MNRLLRCLRPYRWYVLLNMLMTLATSFASLFLPRLMANIVDRGVAAGNVPYLWRTGGLMVLVALCAMGCSVLSMYCAARVGEGYGFNLRDLLFEHVESFSQREENTFGTPSLITRCTNDVTRVQNAVMLVLRVMVGAPIMLVGGMIMAVSTDRRLSVVVLAVIPVIVLLTWFRITHALPLFRAMQEKLDRLNGVLRQVLTGLRVIHSFDRTAWEERRYDAVNTDLAETAVQVDRLMALVSPMMTLLFSLTTVAIVWYGGAQVRRGALQVGTLMAFIQYAGMILSACVMASMLFVVVPRALISARRIEEVLDTVPTVQDPVRPLPAAGPGGVVFDDVSFRYPGAEEPVLSGISFRAEPGETVAVIGSTGSGKSTMVNLIPRFFDVDGGSVTVGGVDVRALPQEELRSRIGYVPQKSFLFSGTIAENLCVGRPDATQEEMWHALEVAQAEGFVHALPEGLQAHLARGATNLSGGQRQRLCIARALIRRPVVYIFDDSFSALDFGTEARLRRSLRQETREACVFLVGQRVGTGMDADRIIVLDEGRIVGMGQHDGLLHSCPIYREIVASQFGAEGGPV